MGACERLQGIAEADSGKKAYEINRVAATMAAETPETVSLWEQGEAGMGFVVEGAQRYEA